MASATDLQTIADSTEAQSRAVVELTNQFDRGLEKSFHRFLTAFGMAVVAATLITQLTDSEVFTSGEFIAALAAGVLLAIVGTVLRAAFFLRAASGQAKQGEKLEDSARKQLEEAVERKTEATDTLREAAK